MSERIGEDGEGRRKKRNWIVVKPSQATVGSDYSGGDGALLGTQVATVPSQAMHYGGVGRS